MEELELRNYFGWRFRNGILFFFLVIKNCEDFFKVCEVMSFDFIRRMIYRDDDDIG